MKKSFLFIILFFVSVTLTAQIEELNRYKYAIVSSHLDFLKKRDQYQTSSLTKFLVAKTGIPTFLDDEKLPEDYQLTRCEGVYVDVIDKSSILTTNISIEFKDCNGAVVYITPLGKSKEKEYKKAYQKAIRAALEEDALHFVYEYAAAQKNEGIANNENESTLSQREIVAIKDTIETLYAQPKSNGFQLINEKPEVVFLLIRTAKEDIFIIKDKNGLLYKKGENWVAETNENGKAIMKLYNIKF